MSMSHKAYAFDWPAFESDDLYGLLFAALTSGDSAGLIHYIDVHREDLKDPYEGNPLADDWRDMRENHDVYEYGDVALTRFYDPAEDAGIGNPWLAIDDQLPEADRAALLGTPFGPPSDSFDPGRLGSYFQTPREVARSLARVRRFKLSALEDYHRKSLERFRDLLEECEKAGSGLYVTF